MGTRLLRGSDLHTDNVNKIGNHTLYKKHGNIKMGNKSWAFKQENLPYPQGVFPGMRLNIDIFENVNQWTETEISARSSEIAAEIQEIWFG